MKSIKIAISGPSQTGKTTLVNIINKEFGLNIIKDFGDELGEDLVFKTMNPKSIIQHQLRVMRRQILAEERLSSFVTDRSLVDYYCFALHWGEESSDISKVVSLFRKYFRNYDATVLLEPNIPEIRESCYRYTILNLLDSMLVKLGEKMYKIPAFSGGKDVDLRVVERICHE